MYAIKPTEQAFDWAARGPSIFTRDDPTKTRAQNGNQAAADKRVHGKGAEPVLVRKRERRGGPPFKPVDMDLVYRWRKEGRTMADIAVEIGVAVNTIHRRLRAAK